MDINKIYNEDCLETMRRMLDNSVDMVMTSPPYDDMDEDFNPIPKRGLRDYKGYSWDFKAIAKEIYRVLKDGGVLVWVVNDLTIDGKETLSSCYQKIYFNKVGFNIHDTMIYSKAGIQYPTHTRYYPRFEYMFILTKGSPKTYNPIKDRRNKYYDTVISGRERNKNGELTEMSGSKKRRRIKEFGVRWNIWEYATGWKHSYSESYLRGHSAIFPEKLAEDHIISWSNSGDLIYDPFMGAGTTAKMAKLNHRNFIGSEISKEYWDLADRRIRETLLPIDI